MVLVPLIHVYIHGTSVFYTTLASIQYKILKILQLDDERANVILIYAHFCDFNWHTNLIWHCAKFTKFVKFVEMGALQNKIF